jgi:hypothetical protein
MNPGLAPLATALGIHKPRVAGDRGSSCLRASSPHHEQGGSLPSSSRESAGASRHSPPNRRTAVVGLAAPPYGLPSTDPTTPAPTARLRRTVGSSSLHSSGARWWSARADNRTRSAFPLDLLPSRGRPRSRPGCGTDDHLLPTNSLLPSASATGPWRARL